MSKTHAGFKPNNRNESIPNLSVPRGPSANAAESIYNHSLEKGILPALDLTKLRFNTKKKINSHRQVE